MNTHDQRTVGLFHWRKFAEIVPPGSQGVVAHDRLWHAAEHAILGCRKYTPDRIMIDRSTNSRDQRDKQSLFHGFTDLETLNRIGPVVLTHREGIHVFDVLGRKYTDAISGLWNSVAGFNHAGQRWFG